ncbi:MAG TPA: rubrerythrin family protein [Acidimicrobiales bacterium]|jgi:rubrerythrin|nr:rubrerythrin family protein [Acidimicrobiales bacterium]
MPHLSGSRTEANLRRAFAAESEANGRFLYYARRAEAEGYPDIAALFRALAEGENGHAFGHLDFLTGGPEGRGDGEGGPSTEDNLKAAIEDETREYTERYPEYARVARQEGFGDVADWFDTLIRAERSHAGRLTAGLESLA